MLSIAVSWFKLATAGGHWTSDATQRKAPARSPVGAPHPSQPLPQPRKFATQLPALTEGLSLELPHAWLGGLQGEESSSGTICWGAAVWCMWRQCSATYQLMPHRSYRVATWHPAAYDWYDSGRTQQHIVRHYPHDRHVCPAGRLAGVAQDAQLRLRLARAALAQHLQQGRLPDATTVSKRYAGSKMPKTTLSHTPGRAAIAHGACDSPGAAPLTQT